VAGWTGLEPATSRALRFFRPGGGASIFKDADSVSTVFMLMKTVACSWAMQANVLPEVFQVFIPETYEAFKQKSTQGISSLRENLLNSYSY
jgi:hypothetical protein